MDELKAFLFLVGAIFFFVVVLIVINKNYDVVCQKYGKDWHHYSGSRDNFCAHSKTGELKAIPR